MTEASAMSVPEPKAQRAYLFLSDDDVVSVADARAYGEACYRAGMERAAHIAMLLRLRSRAVES